MKEKRKRRILLALEWIAKIASALVGLRRKK